MSLIPVLQRQRQVDRCELEISLVYRVCPETVKTTQRNPVSKTHKIFLKCKKKKKITNGKIKCIAKIQYSSGKIGDETVIYKVV